MVAKIDRFTRSKRHLEAAVEELDELGVGFVSVAEAIDSTTAGGRMFRSMLGVFAAFEREQIIERTTSGLRSVARQGFWPGGPAPYGFRLEPDGKHTRLVLDDNETEMIRQAVTLLVDHGCSTHEAAERLNALGYQPRRAPRWTFHNLRRTLLDASLTGTWTYGASRRGRTSRGGEAFDIEVPAILTEERHAALLTALDATRTAPQGKSTYPLSGRLFGPCGHTFTGLSRRDRGSRVYRCNGDRWMALLPEGQEQCGCRRLNAETVETAVWLRHQEQLEAWRSETAAESKRMRNLLALADEAHARLLSGMTPEQQAQVLSLLEVRVTVRGWTVCEHCLGKGKVRGGTGGLMCPECRGARQLPWLRIEGTVFDDVLLEAVNVGDLSDAVLRACRCRSPGPPQSRDA